MKNIKKREEYFFPYKLLGNLNRVTKISLLIILVSIFFVGNAKTINLPYNSLITNNINNNSFLNNFLQQDDNDSLLLYIVNNSSVTITFSWITHEPNSVPGTPIYYGQIVLVPGQSSSGKIWADEQTYDITVSSSDGKFTFTDQNGDNAYSSVSSKTFTTNLYNYYHLYFYN